MTRVYFDWPPNCLLIFETSIGSILDIRTKLSIFISFLLNTRLLLFVNGGGG